MYFSRGLPHPQKRHKNIEFLSNSGLNLLTNYEAAEPAFNDGPLKEVFGSSHPLSTKEQNNKKRCQSWTPSDKSSGSAHEQVQLNFELCLEETVAALRIFFLELFQGFYVTNFQVEHFKTIGKARDNIC